MKLANINRPLFLILSVILIITYFSRNNYKSVNNISPEVVKEPLQKECINKSLIKFTKDDISYEITPLYDYELSGLVVHKMDYRWFSLNKIDNTVPWDLGIIYGSNVKNKVYQAKTIHFTQDYRFCLVRWSENLEFNFDEFTNNHLVVNDGYIEKILQSICAGDQVKIIGKLVNIKAQTPRGEYTWQSSTTRKDREGGACEVIYVQSIKILEKGNPLSYYMFQFCFYALILLALINIISFFAFRGYNQMNTMEREVKINNF